MTILLFSLLFAIAMISFGLLYSWISQRRRRRAINARVDLIFREMRRPQ